LRIIKRRIRFINGKTVTHSPIYATPYGKDQPKIYLTCTGQAKWKNRLIALLIVRLDGLMAIRT
jgi:hypothetical protein